MQNYFLNCYRNVCKPLQLAKLLKLRYLDNNIINKGIRGYRSKRRGEEWGEEDFIKYILYLINRTYTGPDINASKNQISYFAANKGTIRPRYL